MINAVENQHQSDVNSQRVCFKQAAELIKAIFHKIVDWLLLIWFAIQYAVHALLTCSPFSKKNHLQNRLICKTSNFAKFSDLPQFVALKRVPLKVTSEEENKIKERGFTPDQKTLIPKPFNGGHCFGNVTVFLKKWLETHDIEKVAAEFREGTSLKGAIYQEAYETLYSAVYYPDFSQWIERLITLYPLVSFAEEREKWKKNGFDNALVILDALEAYLKKGNDPKKHDLISHVCSWIQKKHNKKLGGKYLASLRQVAQKYHRRDLEEEARMITFFENAGLSVEKIYHLGAKPQDILKTIPRLSEGAYKLSFPKYGSTGKLEGYHSVGLCIDDTRCYLLDSNSEISRVTRPELAYAIGSLFTDYTGIIFSKNPNGEMPSFLTKTLNFLQDRANPPSTSLSPYFELLKITLN